MTDRHWLMPARGDTPPAPRAGQAPAHPHTGPGSAAPPIHAGAGFGFHASGELLRDGARAALSSAVQSRLRELAGPEIDWWAERNADNRLEAAFFGHHGLALAMPVLRDGHQPATEISCYVLDSSSLRNRAVVERPASSLLRRHKPETGLATQAKDVATITAGPANQLSAAARGVLGNLPAEAQQLMQAPFSRSGEILGCDWHYEGTEREISVFMMYLASAKDVTVATGSSTISSSTAQAARWNLQIYRAHVVRRIGRNTWIRG